MRLTILRQCEFFQILSEGLCDGDLSVVTLIFPSRCNTRCKE